MSDSGQSYDEEQAALQKELEGGDEPNFTVPQAFPEVNPEVYKDVEQILFRGFIHQSAVLNDVLFVFKSINHHEYEMISLATGGEGSAKVKDYYDLFLSYGVLMVDGQNILTDRPKHLPDLKEFFDGLPKTARQKVIRYLSEINRRSFKATILTEAFVMESTSRLRWAQLHGSTLSSTAVTGISGTDGLGLNWAQLTWNALNYYEDLKVRSESDWENAKFVASSMAGKGMSKVHSADRTRRQKEREEQIARRDRLLRHVLVGASLEGPAGDGTVVKQVASTVQELGEQLKKDLKGEKDWHDHIIEAHERRVREGYEQKAQQLQAVVEQRREEFGGRNILGATDFGGVNLRDVQDRILRRRQIAAQNQASQIVYPELYDEKHEEFMEKWNLPRATTVKPTDRDTSGALPLPPTRPAGTPWKGK